MTIFIEGKKHEFSVPPNNTIMSAAEKSRLTLPCMCKQGECGTCTSKLLSGIVTLQEKDHTDLFNLPKENCLTCIGYPMSDDVVIFYDNN